MNLPLLAERLRPNILDELTGQQHLMNKAGILKTILFKHNNSYF